MKPFNALVAPFVHVAEAHASAVTDFVLVKAAREPDAAVRVLRGRKMLTDESLFDEVAAALQFPDYFGENWNALLECVCDLSWLPAARYLLILRDADVLLAAAPDIFELFARRLSESSAEWAHPGGATRPWAPEQRAFHTVLHSNVGAAPLLENALAKAGLAHDRVCLDATPTHDQDQ